MTVRAHWSGWLVLLLWFAPVAYGEELLGQWQDRAAERALVGTWRTTIGNVYMELVLRDDSTFTLDDLQGHYRVEDNRLVLTNGAVVTYAWQLTDAGLVLSGSTLRAPITFTRAPHVPGYFTWVWDLTPEAVWQRVNRILFILGIVVAARVIIWLLRITSAFLIFSTWGPLGLLYRHNKNRAKTIHSLVLNVIKYFIYFTALGMILGELGINYTTYIASLSVIGLAIGFGSQGLVQDMVTGFFIIFEGQFDVGDMVEISGQTGYVTEIGLRMTKIRNYLGQIVVIPNRNIATVANYSRGAQRVYIDAAVADEPGGERALPILRTLGMEMQKQYDGVLLQPVKVSGPMKLETGETFVRLHFSIWPNQTWIVDQQVVPRVRERLRDAGIDNPGDRVAPFYHAREIIPVPHWRERLAWVRKRFADGGAHSAHPDHPTDHHSPDNPGHEQDITGSKQG
jgi:small-conductance mechanosensitive channel